jgi:nitrite reductase (NADH) large subunit
MESLVGSYQCEWKTTLASEEKLKRFRQFANSDKEDSRIVFVQEREQIRPAHENERESLKLVI